MGPRDWNRENSCYITTEWNPSSYRYQPGNSLAPNRAWAKVRLPKGITDHQTQSRLSKRYIVKFGDQKTSKRHQGTIQDGRLQRVPMESSERPGSRLTEWGLFNCPGPDTEPAGIYSTVESLHIPSQLNALGRVEMERES